MPVELLERNPLELTEIQRKMVKSAWGTAAVENVIVEKISYLSDGLKVNGYAAFPNDSGEKFPSIIWCRGGIGNAGAIDSFNAQGIFGQLASWGYCVFSTQYRGNAGGDGRDEFGGDDLNDVLNLIPVAEKFERADVSTWGIEGWSRGGMMAYLTLTKTDIFNCAVVTGGIADLRCSAKESVFMKRLSELTMGEGNSESFDAKCSSRSIVNFPEKLSKTSPILIIHGTADNRVLPHDSLDLSYKLLEHEIPFRLMMLENGDHFLKSHREEVDRARKNWYSKYLKGEKKE